MMEKEKRLIDAVRFREVLDRYANAPHVTMQYSALSKMMRIAIDTCIELLDMQQSVDAVEVVRCKDCKHWKAIGVLEQHWECQIFCGLHDNGYLTGADDFCSYGERKYNE